MASVDFPVRSISPGCLVRLPGIIAEKKTQKCRARSIVLQTGSEDVKVESITQILPTQLTSVKGPHAQASQRAAGHGAADDFLQQEVQEVKRINPQKEEA